MTLNRVTSTYVDVTDTFSMLLSGVPTFTIDSLGRAEGKEILVEVSEAKRRRFTDFEDYPAVGVPGEVVYTGVAGTDPTFGEDFIGYLDSRGWVSLTDGGGSGSGNNLIIQITPGTPPVYPTPVPGSGILWLGAPGYETEYEPVNSVTYYTDADGNTYDILSNHVWEKIGNDAKFKLSGKVIIGDGVSNGSLQFVDGNEADGYVLTSDVAGNASWQPAGGSGFVNSSYVEIVDFVQNTPYTISHSLDSEDIVVRFIDLDTDEEIEGHVSSYTLNTVDVELSRTNDNVKVVILSAGGVQTGKLAIRHTITDGLQIGANHMYNIWGDFNIEPGVTVNNKGRLSIVNGSFNNNGNYIQGPTGSVEIVNTNIDYILGRGNTLNGQNILWTGATGAWFAGESIAHFDAAPGNALVSKEWVLANAGGTGPGATGGTTTIKNIDKYLTPLATIGNNQTTGIAISEEPSIDGFVDVRVNGQGARIGDASMAYDCYFSDDSGASAKAIADITIGDVLYWNGTNAGFDLSNVGDHVSLFYIS